MPSDYDQSQVAQPPRHWLTYVNTRTYAGFPLVDIFIGLGLIISIFAVYAQTSGFDFVNFDDNGQVYHNPHVQEGLKADSVRWAMTAVVISNWMPMTLLSHLLDVQIFGLHPGFHHLMNVVYHSLAALLLFAALRRATRARAPSAFVAFIFALHPLHVESVAWISERKDVLSAFFFFLAIYAYVRYTERPSPVRYSVLTAIFCLGLMSKPMVVTFPFVLLLLDFWPLQRARWPRTLWEKLPLIALAAARSALSLVVQESTGGVTKTRIDARVAEAVKAYFIYLWQMFWPVHLAAFYPYPKVIVVWHVIPPLLILGIITVFAVHAWRKYPYVATGWFWFLGTLVPVIGFIRIGLQAHADRYMYIPSVGLTIMLAWGAIDMVRSRPESRPAIATVAALTCIGCAVLTYVQIGYWRNGGTLFQHAIDVTAGNYFAETALGEYLMRVPGREPEAAEHFEMALAINPDYPSAHNNLGVYLARADLCGLAIPHFQAALRGFPNNPETLGNLGICLEKTGKVQDAAAEFERVSRIAPSPASHLSLAEALSQIPGRESEAIAEYTTGLRFRPINSAAYQNLGELLERIGRLKEAQADFAIARKLRSPSDLTILPGTCNSGLGECDNGSSQDSESGETGENH